MQALIGPLQELAETERSRSTADIRLCKFSENAYDVRTGRWL